MILTNTNGSASLLVQQSTWLRRLAHELISDPALAEDASQEALLAALQRPPQGMDNPRTLRAWLRKVIRHKAIEIHRDRAARTVRESRAARSESGDVEDPVERAALAHELGAIVLALEEPARTLLLLRYQEGLTAPEIAKRMQTTPAAVRKRLSRALSSLRIRMDASHDGRRAVWALPLARWSTGASSVPKVGLALAIAAPTAAAVVAAGVLWWQKDEQGASEEVARAGLPALAAATSEGAASDGASGGGLETSRTADSASSGASGVAAAPAAAPGSQEGSILVEGRVRSSAGDPLANQLVTLGWNWSSVDPIIVRTNDEGRFEERLDEPYKISPHSFLGHGLSARADAAGHQAAVWRSPRNLRFRGPDQTSRLTVDLDLAPGFGLSGRVLDSNAKPVFDAPLMLVDEQFNVLVQARSFQDGRFEFSGLVTDSDLAVRVVARDQSRGVVFSKPVQLPMDGDVVLRDLMFPAEASLAGYLQDEFGRPARGVGLRAELVGSEAPASRTMTVADRAQLESWSTHGLTTHGSTTVGSDGSFRISGLKPGTYLVKGLGAANPLGYYGELETGQPMDLKIEFGLVMGVVDEDGLPVVGASITTSSILTNPDGSGGERITSGNLNDPSGSQYLPVLPGKVHYSAHVGRNRAEGSLDLAPHTLYDPVLIKLKFD